MYCIVPIYQSVLKPVLAASMGLAIYAFTQNPPNDASQWKAVEDAMGRPGQMQPGNVMKFSMPRKNLHVELDGTQIKPGLALGSWAAFKKDDGGSMVMGDLVLTGDEVEPVMMKLQESGISLSALHNHLMGESPGILYMHIAAHADAVQLAKAIHDALALTKTPGPDNNPASSPTPELGFDQKKVEEALGRSGKVNGGILQFPCPERKPSPIQGWRCLLLWA